jgi:hypothetical protein
MSAVHMLTLMYNYVQSIALRSWCMVRAHVLGAVPALYLLAPFSLHVCCGCLVRSMQCLLAPIGACGVRETA